MSRSIGRIVVGVGIFLVLHAPGTQAVVVVSDSFAVTGLAPRTAGATLLNVPTETGGLVWKTFGGAMKFDSEGVGYVYCTGTSGADIPYAVTSDMRVSVDVNLNGYTGTGAVMVGFSKAQPAQPYNWPVFMSVTGAGVWKLVDYDTAAHTVATGTGLNTTGWHTMTLEYDPTTKTANIWYDTTQLVTNMVLVENVLSPIGYVGFGNNPTYASGIQFDNFVLESIPEPVTLALLGMAVPVLGWRRRHI